jgi:hypothetical protein
MRASNIALIAAVLVTPSVGSRSTLPPFFPGRNRFAPQGPLCRNRVISGGDWQASRRS